MEPWFNEGEKDRQNVLKAQELGGMYQRYKI